MSEDEYMEMLDYEYEQWMFQEANERLEGPDE